MTFYKKFLLNSVLFLVNVLAFLEQKLSDLVKHFLVLGLNATIIGFVYFNGPLFYYFANGLLIPEDVNNYNLPETKYNYPKSEVLGYATVSKVRELPDPVISSQVALVMDKNTNAVLYDLNSTQEVAPASTTKLMTALVALDIYKMDDVLEVPIFCTNVDGSKVGLPYKKSFTVENLLSALLIQSGADAACVLSNSNVKYMDFVTKMNDKAKELGMEKTSFTNPIGLDGVNFSHYSTAKDLYTLAKKAVENEKIAEIVSQKNKEIKSTDDKYSYNLTNTNKLLWEIPNTKGIKTGTTLAAGEVLIYEYAETEKALDLIIIVMNSSDRFYDTKNLLNWTLSSYSWEK